MTASAAHGSWLLVGRVAAAEECSDEVIGQATRGGMTTPILRRSPPFPDAGTVGNVDAMALYAGESVSAVQRLAPAADIIRELMPGAG